uniref:Two pore domain potassium channel family protein n=1 Tax=Desulfobacca acetoxidans TaxID=60893 RepID=A0A7V4G8C5_9BACT
MTQRLLPFRHFWSEDHGLTGLLIFFLGYFILLNSMSEFWFGRLAAHVLFSLIIMTGVLTIFSQKWLRPVVLALAAISLAFNLGEQFRPTLSLATLNACFSLGYLGLLLPMIVVRIFQEGPITGHRIQGAIVVYLLLGGIFSLLYQVTAFTLPQAFRWSDGLPSGDPNLLRRELTYFSFITLTTTGYGDITAVHPLARTLVMLEALVGQLYPAIVLAWLVSLAVTHKPQKS